MCDCSSFALISDRFYLLHVALTVLEVEGFPKGPVQPVPEHRGHSSVRLRSRRNWWFLQNIPDS